MRERQILGEPHSPADRPERPGHAVRPGPSVAVVLVLTALVLLAHAALVVDGWPALSRPTATPSAVPTHAVSQDGESADTAPEPPRSAKSPAIHVTQVRWIAATPTPSDRPRPPPNTTAPVRPQAPTPAPPPAPTAIAPAPEPSNAQAAPSSSPEPVEVAQAPAVVPTEEIASASAPTAPVERATTTPLPAAHPPTSAHLVYEVQGAAKGLRYQADGELIWKLQGDRYEARMEVKMFLLGSRVQTSTGTLGPEGLRPERFADIRRGERATHFERDTGRIRFSSNAPEVALQDGAQDRLSLFLQLAGLLQASPRKEGDTLSFQVAGTGGAETWRFEVGPEETLALPAGDIAARRVVRRPRDTYDTLVEMWFAPSLHHLPVRLRLTQANGDVADQLLRALP